MAGKQRHMFPGNNTPEGFFSYYRYIISQEEANRIYCIKGGPGVGKSTFMKKIAEDMLELDYDIDFMHCSSDSESIDGILIRQLKIAFIDATSPHIVDPISPGAVDSIINLGDYWNEESLRQHKKEIIESRLRISGYFSKAYNYLASAKSMYNNLRSVYSNCIMNTEIYKIAAGIIVKELSHKEICVKEGYAKKFFASAITPSGCVNTLNSLLDDFHRIYVLEAPVGVQGEYLLKQFAESSLYRGFDVESFYCPLDPSSKMEHLLIPDLKVAFVTSNDYHPIDKSSLEGEIIVINLERLINEDTLSYDSDIVNDSEIRLQELIEMAVECIKKAKTEHDNLESYYIPNMDYKRIEEVRLDVMDKILNK